VGVGFEVIMKTGSVNSILSAKGAWMPRFTAGAVWLLVLAVLVTCTACGTKRRSYTAYDARRYITEHDLKNLPPTNIPIVINERVIAWMEYFQGAGRKHFQRYMERSGRYMPLMKAILKEQGMPTDLVYIALIESGFNTHAYSRAAAVGPWQFIGSTGKIYKLRIDGWVDERRDPVKSTYAAAKLFRDLYNDYGDWYLAMVGYNAGPGRVAKAMEITGSRDFWVMADHKKALKAETRDYVPKYIAATIMAKAPEKFGFRNLDYHEPWEHESAAVETQTDLSVIAKCAGVSEATVFDLNPHLVRGATPPNERNYRVRLPKGTTGKFLAAYAKVPEDERVQIVRHKVRRGDTMYKIARRYGVGVNALAKANGLSRKSRLQRGSTLIVPVGSYAKYAKFESGGGSGSGKRSLIRYRVKRGDTLSGIAAKYRGVTVSDIRRWNRLRSRSHIRAGQKLKIYMRGSGPSYASSSSGGGGAGYHTVRRGETLGTIARRYGTTTKKLMALNGITNPKSLRAGKKIKVSGDASPSSGSSSSSKSGGAATSTYVVKSGDSPGVIAERFGMSTKQLMAMNGIKDPRRLRAGMKLKVSGGSGAPATSSDEVEPVALPADLVEDVAVKDEPVVETVPRKAASSRSTHTVRSGETLGAIAVKYGTTTKRLMAMNGIKDPRRVRAGTKLKVDGPASSSEIAESATPSVRAPATGSSSSAAGTHTVRSGETLGEIAAKYGVTTKQLMAWNGIKNPRRVRAGTKLVIKGGTAPKAKAEKSSARERAATPAKMASQAPAPEARPVTHKVRSGETLWDIARRHNVTIAQLQKWNNLSDPSAVRAGTTLKIVKN